MQLLRGLQGFYMPLSGSRCTGAVLAHRVGAGAAVPVGQNGRQQAEKLLDRRQYSRRLFGRYKAKQAQCREQCNNKEIPLIANFLHLLDIHYYPFGA